MSLLLLPLDRRGVSLAEAQSILPRRSRLTPQVVYWLESINCDFKLLVLRVEDFLEVVSLCFVLDLLLEERNFVHCDWHCVYQILRSVIAILELARRILNGLLFDRILKFLF